MTRNRPNQSAGKVMFVRPGKEVDAHLQPQGLGFLALELAEIPPAPKQRARKAPTTGKHHRPARRSAGKEV